MGRLASIPAPMKAVLMVALVSSLADADDYALTIPLLLVLVPLELLPTCATAVEMDKLDSPLSELPVRPIAIMIRHLVPEQCRPLIVLVELGITLATPQAQAPVQLSVLLVVVVRPVLANATPLNLVTMPDRLLVLDPGVKETA